MFEKFDDLKDQVVLVQKAGASDARGGEGPSAWNKGYELRDKTSDDDDDDMQVSPLKNSIRSKRSYLMKNKLSSLPGFQHLQLLPTKASKHQRIKLKRKFKQFELLN